MKVKQKNNAKLTPLAGSAKLTPLAWSPVDTWLRDHNLTLRVRPLFAKWQVLCCHEILQGQRCDVSLRENKRCMGND